MTLEQRLERTVQLKRNLYTFELMQKVAKVAHDFSGSISKYKCMIAALEEYGQEFEELDEVKRAKIVLTHA